MNKKLMILVIVAVIAVSLIGVLSPRFSGEKQQKGRVSGSPAPTMLITEKNAADKTASFVIFTQGTLRIFTDSRYHNQSENVYLQSENPNIVYVKKTGIRWDDFFRTLPMKLTKECLTTGTGQVFCTSNTGRLRFFINGKEDSGALDKEIKNGDKLLVTYGNENDSAILEQLQKIPNPQ